MKTKFIYLASLVVLVLSIQLLSDRAFGQTNQELNFNISTTSFYYPGEKVTVNINSYIYNRENKRTTFDFEITVYRITDIEKFYSLLSARSNYEILGSDSSNLLFLTKETETIGRTLRLKNEYGYGSMNETITLNSNDKGAYLVRVQTGNRVAYCGYVVTELGVITKVGESSILAFSVNRQSGSPVSDANLSFYVGESRVGSGVTSNGIFLQNVSSNYFQQENKSPLVIGRKGEDIIISDPYLYFNYSGEKYFVYTYTNQPVYRTGSEVNFKGTIRTYQQGDYKPYPSKEVTVLIKDSKNAEVYKEKLWTNENGSYNGSIVLDEAAALGTYYITTQIDEKNSHSASFEVEQFKKPEYKVDVTTDKSQYLGNDRLTAKVKAMYYFGSPVNGGEVEYNVYRKRYYKPWWSFSPYSWWYEDYYNNLDDNQRFSGSEQIHSGKGQLDAEGNFTFDYTIDQDFKEEDHGWWYWRRGASDYQYIVQAKVTDKSRREISGLTTVFVTRGAFTLTGNTDKYWYKPGDRVGMNVRASDFSNKPIETEFKVELYQINYGKGYDYNPIKSLVTTLNGETNAAGDGIVYYTLPSNSEGSYEAKIIAYDDKRNEVNATINFYVSSGDFSWWRRDQSSSVSIMTDKETYSIGDNCGVYIFSPVSNPDILVTTESNDIITYNVVKVTGEVYFFEFVVTEKYGTNFNISANFVHDGTYYSQTKSAAVLREDKFLTVNVETTADIFKPRDKEFFKVKVTDHLGNAVRNAEVSVGIIDESIYAIKPDNTKDVRKFFYGPGFTGLSTSYATYNSNVGYGRNITFMEAYNIKSLNDPDLATVSGRILSKTGEPVFNLPLMIDRKYEVAYTDEEGRFSFKMPAGNYELGYQLVQDEYINLSDLRLNKRERLSVSYSIDYNEVLIEGVRTPIQTEQSGRLIQSEEINIRGGRSKDATIIIDGVVQMSVEESYESSLVTPDVRSDFRDAILWSPYTTTDASGYAYLTVDFPDNLTEWRITSRVITADTKVGQTARTVITRKDLLVRMETPRFFRQGDEVTISTIVHNYLKETKRTTVRFKAENLVFNGERERIIELKPNEDTRLDWVVKVDEPVGEAMLYVEALTNEESDAVELKVPLQPKGLRVTQNTIADFEDEIKTELKYINIPDQTDIRTTSMKFSVAPSLASTILNSLDELAGYPYGCVEQTMSRFLPTVVVAKAYKELNAPVSDVTKKDLPKFVDAGLKRLYGFQQSDGSWGWWMNDGTNPFMTAYVLYGFYIATEAGYSVSAPSFNRGITALKRTLNTDMDATTRAYVNYVLAYTGNATKQLIEDEYKKISTNENEYALSLMALAFEFVGDNTKALELVSLLESKVQYSGEGAAFWETSGNQYRWQDDKVQTTAMALKALMNIKSDSELKNKIVRWLMMQRRGMSWRSTQETAFIIFAMVDYLKVSSELTPDYDVKVFVNGELQLDKRMTSVDVFAREQIVTLDDSQLRKGSNEIRIEKSGRGKVYFSAGADYYLDDGSVLARENGFRVEREYHKLEQYDVYGSDVITYRKKYFDGQLKSGEHVLVKLKVYAKDNVNNFFMIEDPIPSGAEVIKDDWQFKIQDENQYAGYNHYWWRWWYADKDIWDDRVTFFATNMYGKEFEFSYILRAQIPGTYSVNPSQGMLMYYDEVNGSSDKLSLRIVD